MLDAKFCLLSLAAAPALEDALVDWLMEQQAVSGFTSSPINGHGASVHAMSPLEQVAGSRRRVLFQISLPMQVIDALLEQLCSAFAGADIHYWYVPVLGEGNLSGAGPDA